MIHFGIEHKEIFLCKIIVLVFITLTFVTAMFISHKSRPTRLVLHIDLIGSNLFRSPQLVSYNSNKLTLILLTC